MSCEIHSRCLLSRPRLDGVSISTGSLGLFQLLLLPLLVLSLSENNVEAEEARPHFHAAFVDRDISPDIGMEQPGGYGKAFHRSLHDPCKARIGVFHDGRETPEAMAVVVSLDALIVRRATVKNIRERIEQATGIPGGQVLMHATHSHSSGPTGMILPGEYDHASEFIQELAYEKSSMANAEYLKRVEDAVVEGVTQAHQNLQPVRYGIGRGEEPTVAFNRRFRMKNGLSFTHPRPGNPDIVEPAGPTDPEVGVLGVWDEQNQLQGCVVNFVCHATTNPGGISANYIAYVEKAIRGMFGEQVVVVFLAGASGDVTQVDNLSLNVPKRGAAMTALVGGRVGAEAVKVLLGMTTGTQAPVAVRQEVLEIPRRQPRREHIEAAQALVAMEPREAGITQWTFAKETLLLQAKLEQEPVAEVEVQTVQIGPLAIVTCPAEYFCQYGLDIKAGSPFPYTFIASLSNGCVGYVPTLEAFGENGGGYETRLTSYSNLVITAGDTIAETGIRLTQQLTPSPAPQPEKIPDFQGPPWEYGSLPPQRD